MSSNITLHDEFDLFGSIVPEKFFSSPMQPSKKTSPSTIIANAHMLYLHFLIPVPTCAHILQELLAHTGISASEWIARSLPFCA